MSHRNTHEPIRIHTPPNFGPPPDLPAEDADARQSRLLRERRKTALECIDAINVLLTEIRKQLDETDSRSPLDHARVSHSLSEVTRALVNMPRR